jgi:hypothetical protein
LLSDALETDSIHEAVRVLKGTTQASVEVFERDLLPALSGGWVAVKNVVRTWLSLLNEAQEAQLRTSPPRETQRQQVTMLQSRVADAPGSTWVFEYGPGLGTVLSLIEDVRRADDRLTPFPLPPRSGFPDLGPGADFVRYRRLVDVALRGEAPPLERAQELFELNLTELAELFGVTRQALQQWRVRGTPESQRQRLDDLIAVGELLDRKLKPGRISLVAARPAKDFGGRSILQMFSEGRGGHVRRGLESAFDWSATA